MARRVRRHVSVKRADGPVAVDTRQLALDIAEQLRAAIPVRVKATFKALADSWLAANSGRLVAPDNEARHIRHLKPLWELTEDALTPSAVKQTLSGLVGLGASTRNKVRSTGRLVIQEAQESGVWDKPNPFAVVKRSKESRPKFRLLSLEEIGRLLPHLRVDRRRLVKVALLLGMRPGEMLGLKKEDVNLATRMILVRRSHARATTKTGTWREVPIPDEALTDLETAISASPTEYVFPKKDGGRQRKDTKLARMLRTAMGKAGIVSCYRYSCRRKGCGHKEERVPLEQLRCPKCDFKLWAHPVAQHVRFYDLRHAAATLHRQAGADPLAIKLTLGHAKRDPTDDVYTHLSDEDVRRELNKLSLKQESQMIEPEASSLGSSCSTAELPPRVLWPWVEPQPLMTVKDVAARLAVKRATIYRLAAAGALRVVHVGSLLRFRAEDVEAFVAGRAQ